MSEQSLDLKDSSRRVYNRMWWKNKKVTIGIVLLVIVILAIVIWAIVG